MRSLAIAAIICSVCVTLVASEFEFLVKTDQAKKLRDDCLRDNQLTQEDLNVLGQCPSKFSENVKCFLKCLAEKYGVMSPEGEFHEDKVEAKLREALPDNADRANELLKNFNHCKVKTGDNHCHTAAIVFHCVFDHEHHD